LSTAAALGFDIIAAEYPELDLPVVKFLYKQKLFHTVMGKIINNNNYYYYYKERSKTTSTEVIYSVLVVFGLSLEVSLYSDSEK